ncbi:MAG TPA: hypothetical protein VFC79_01030, partial [Tissierellaceae bacterium]|nr:hypothetical protein [Tissierellaceae bacterium]
QLGIIDIFGNLVKYSASGRGGHSLPHITYTTSQGEKIIYVLGYDNKTRWKKALGGQYGCVYIDEINIADMEYVREISMRTDYLIATLNPDDPELPVYKEYINHSRPLPEYKDDAPGEINKQLNKEHKENWVHWFFSFEHNEGLTSDKLKQIIGMVPKGTKLYQNKIQGLRGRAEGLIFPNFEYDKNVITEHQARVKEYVSFSLGVDTSYSQKTNDTISFIFQGLTNKGELIILEELVLNNKDNKTPFSPSDIAQRLFTFADYCKDKWGFSRHIHVDNADQATITELYKLKRNKPNSYNVLGSDKSVQIIDRINLMLGWIKDRKYLVVDHCNSHMHEINTYSWKGDEPEDANDHTINASQYGFIPIRDKVGIEIVQISTKDKIKQAKRLFR